MSLSGSSPSSTILAPSSFSSLLYFHFSSIPSFCVFLFPPFYIFTFLPFLFFIFLLFFLLLFIFSLFFYSFSRRGRRKIETRRRLILLNISPAEQLFSLCSLSAFLLSSVCPNSLCPHLKYKSVIG